MGAVVPCSFWKCVRILSNKCGHYFIIGTILPRRGCDVNGSVYGLDHFLLLTTHRVLRHSCGETTNYIFYFPFAASPHCECVGVLHVCEANVCVLLWLCGSLLDDTPKHPPTHKHKQRYMCISNV